ncbi:MAG: restriction endonuclease [Candidatus Thiodiazotropha sp. 6PDIVS]
MIPDYQTLMLPVLESSANGEVVTSDVVDALAIKFSLTEEEKEQLLPSGKQTTFSNRVHWAKGYLKQAGLLRYTKRGHFIITDEGKKVLATKPEKIDNKFLEQFEAFQEFRSRKGTQSGSSEADKESILSSESATPDELLRSAHKAIDDALAGEILDKVREATPEFFEELIVDLLLAMGYGGTSENAGRAIGKSGDDGVDGVIDQDPLGVDQIYVQAKRYAEGNNIGSGAIRDFFGALNLKKAQKGIFFTSSSFSSSATQTANDLGSRIVLIDGKRLAKLMIRYNIGCRDEEILHIKKLDEAFFEQ